MTELFANLNSNPTLMFIGAIALVVGLFIVLVVVISSMRVRTYREKFIDVQEDNHEKSLLITNLEKQLEELQIKNRQNTYNMKQYIEIKERFHATEATLMDAIKVNDALKDLQAQTKSELESTQSMHQQLFQEYEALEEHLKVLTDEKNKLLVNNARLLMKLEGQVRLSSSK